MRTIPIRNADHSLPTLKEVVGYDARRVLACTQHHLGVHTWKLKGIFQRVVDPLVSTRIANV